MNISRFIEPLRPVDALVIFFAIFLSVLDVFFVPFETASWLIAANIVASIVIVAFSSYRAHHPSISWLHDWYPVPIIFFTFKEIHVIIQSIARPDIDVALIEIDRWMFGGDPTVFLAQFIHPALTEILQIAYTSFYFIMLTLGIELYMRKDFKKFTFSTFTMSYGFYLSYIGYLLFPGVGPRFTLHDFYLLDTELSGLWLTQITRDIINAGESIPPGISDAFKHAQRDVFPSGHTQMTLIVLYFANKYKLKSRYVLYFFGSLLIVATVYLRYHYVIDLLAGALFMLFTVWTAPKIARWWDTLREKV
ncbi:MAG: phosphatase PAP2 family protein [Ignavibacteriae bacterium]|nr:phosphatase PAP2 family protein [Ignavibacteriota bacterium]